MTSATRLAGNEIAQTASIGDYIELLKPKVMSLVVFTAFVGLWIAPGTLHPLLAFIAIFAIAIGAGASGAINMWYDRDIDAQMVRTQKRPLPMQKIAPDDALFLGVFLSILAIMLLGLATNWLAAGLLAFASFFYIFVYTIGLKRRTAQNIVIGGAAGAFPPMIGWAAVTGDITWLSFGLFAIIFLWTPPHFWALALYRSTDYKKVSIPMMPSVAGEKSTKRQMLIYTIILAFVSLVPYALGEAGFVYLSGTLILNALFIVSAVRVVQEPEGHYLKARQMFAYSVFYLFALYAFLIIDTI